MVPYVRKSFLKHFKDGLKYVEGLSEDEIKKLETEIKNDEKSEEENNDNERTNG